MRNKLQLGYAAYLCLCLFGIISPYLVFNESVTVWDIIYGCFYGVSPVGGFSLLPYLFYVVVFLGIVYLYQVHITEYFSNCFSYDAIRHGSLFRWFVKLSAKIALIAIVLLFILVMLTIIVGIVSGYRLTLTVTVRSDIEPFHVLYQFLVNGWLQIINSVMIVFITAWLSKDISYNLIVLGLLMLAVMPMINVGGWLPAGLNSMGYLNGSWVELYRITGVLAIYLIFELGAVFILFRTKKMASIV